MRIYIESTIPSYVVARPSRDSMKAMRQQLTKDWWEFKRQEHDLFMSQVVLDEIRLGEPEMAAKRLKLMKPIALLDLTNEVKMLAREVLESGLLPIGADRDATHIALATTHKMDILLSWNCRHITNAFIQERLRRLATDFGYMLPVLCTPDELLNDLL